MSNLKPKPAAEINLEEFERRLRAAAAPQAGVEDPLAELTRLVDTIAGACSIGAVVLLCRFWKPRDAWKLPVDPGSLPPQSSLSPASSGTTASVFQAWMPWLILTAFLSFASSDSWAP